MQNQSPLSSAPSWHVVCLDYVENEPCFKCGRLLSAGKTYVVLFPNGQKAFAGKTCAWKLADNEDHHVPDLTKFLSASVEQGVKTLPFSPINTENERERTYLNNPDQEDRSMVEAYLRLRYERLVEMEEMALPGFLADDYEQLQACKLSEQRVRVLSNSIRTIALKTPALSLDELKKLYFIYYWLIRCLSSLVEPSKRTFIEGLLKILRSKWTLSDGQMAAAFKFLKHLPGAPRPRAFKLIGRPIKKKTVSAST